MHDIAEEKIAKLQQGCPTFYERGLPELLTEHHERITFTTSLDEVINRAEYLFIAVGTPSMENGAADTQALYEVVEAIKARVTTEKIIIIKSTVPVGTACKIRKSLAGSPKEPLLHFVSNPEFLREGNAVYDFLEPDRIVIGGTNPEILRRVAALYDTINAPILLVNNQEAEIIKYASNNFLAMKISFINEMAGICEEVGADIVRIAYGIGLDHRIGAYFLQAGLGFGGPCLNKDLLEMIWFMKNELAKDPLLLEATLQVNELQGELVLKKLQRILGDLHGKKIGLLGLAFKPDTDDMRNAPALRIIERLLREGAEVVAFDPMATENARRLLGERIGYAKTAAEVAEQAAGLVIVTEWKEFLLLDYRTMQKMMIYPLLIDGRNMFEQEEILDLIKLGFHFEGIGRAVFPKDVGNRGRSDE